MVMTHTHTQVHLTRRVFLYVDIFTQRQAEHRSPLFQSTVCKFPHVLVQCTAVHAKCLTPVFKEDAENVFLPIENVRRI